MKTYMNMLLQKNMPKDTIHKRHDRHVTTTIALVAKLVHDSGPNMPEWDWQKHKNHS